VRIPARHQIEIATTLGSMVALLVLPTVAIQFGVWPQGIGFAVALLLIAQPPALVGLLEHFQPVATRLRWAVYGCAGLALLGQMAWPWPRPSGLFAVTALYFAVAQGLVGWAAWTEVQRRGGVTRWRLGLLGIGTATAVVLAVIEAVSWLFGMRPALPVQAVLSLVALAGYWLGLAPPPRLLRAWQRTELIELLRRTAEREPDDRLAHVAGDLARAVARTTTAASATAVAIGRDELTIEASSDAAWEGLRIVPAMGLVGVGIGGADPVVGPPDECERPVKDLVDGQVVAVVPITRSTPCWGAVVIAQRRESRFLADDLASVAVLCRHAADVIDYARLTVDSRRYRPQVDDLRVSV